MIAAAPFAYFKIGLPGWLETSGQYLAQTTLPLALICIGGTLSLAAMRKSGNMALSSSLVKMIGLPVLATLGAWLLGLSRGGAGDSVSVLRQPDRRGQFCHGPCRPMAIMNWRRRLS